MLKLRHILLAIILLLVMMAGTGYPADQTVTLVWDASASIDITGYNVYSGPSESGPWDRLNTDVIVETTYQHVYTDDIEAAQWFYVTATDGRNESEPSNIVDCKVDTIAPGKVGTLTLSSD